MISINTFSLPVSELVSLLTPLYNSLSNKDGIDRKTLDPTYYVDIKSQGLRDILKTVLRDIRAVNLNEDKPAVLLPSSFSF